MARWTRLYDELAGPRYPFLLAYAQLLTGDREAADALVASALKRTFARPRRFDGVGPVELQVRREIVTRFLARAGEFEPPPAPVETDRDVASAAETSPTPQPSEHEPANPYAPPAPGQEPVTPPAAPLTPAEGDGADSSARASAGVADPADAAPEPRDEEAVLREALLALPPQARAVALLRHHDGLTPGQICERLGLSLDGVRSALQDVRRVARTRLGIELEVEPHAEEGLAGSEVTVADHAGRA
ncbi:sigma factor-like helix-turn-helix DNA-binding protein [Demequina sp. SO4-18]|uniref:RNA polymerase sigma factor n=1 Tax=Demequina sp. SO4-18 TaxID=3401026 RepID=UPI003B5BF245